MASLIENLISILEKENNEYNQLLNLSLDKTSVVVKGDIEKLQVIVAQEQEKIEIINKLEKTREENIKDIANVLNIPENEFKLDNLIKMLEKQPQEQEDLSKVRDAFKRTMNKLVKINDNNRVLLQESINMIEFELNLSRNTMSAPETANYSKAAYNTTGQNLVAGSFDAKQ